MLNGLVELLGGPTNAYALASSGGAGGEQPIWGMLFPFVLVFGIIYFLMIRPQQKKQQEHQNMLNALKTGDNVIAGGIYGEITKIKDDVIQLKVADNVRIRVHRSAVSSVLSTSGQSEEAKDKPSKEKSSEKS